MNNVVVLVCIDLIDAVSRIVCYVAADLVFSYDVVYAVGCVLILQYDAVVSVVGTGADVVDSVALNYTSCCAF